MRELRIPIFVEEKSGFNREGEPVRVGIPLPRELVQDAREICVVSASRGRIAHQARPLALWPDGSLKWLLVDGLVTLG
ncbi:MAG: hypothetical protein ACREU6_09335, partial [Steroidobacteraceae bacterium]